VLSTFAEHLLVEGLSVLEFLLSRFKPCQGEAQGEPVRILGEHRLVLRDCLVELAAYLDRIEVVYE